MEGDFFGQMGFIGLTNANLHAITGYDESPVCSSGASRMNLMAEMPTVRTWPKDAPPIAMPNQGFTESGDT
jgi:hypothetical protein